MRIIANFAKEKEAGFISHLDIQRLMQRAMRRASIPVKYSQGFNPHPLLAFASALSVGFTSNAEWMDIRLEAPITPQDFMQNLNAALPDGLKIISAMEMDEREKPLTALMQQARYQITFSPDVPISRQACETAIEKLLREEISVLKRTKGGMKQVDIRPQLLSMRLEEGADTKESAYIITVEGVLNAEGGLQIPLLMQAYMEKLGVQGRIKVHRSFVKFDRIEV